MCEEISKNCSILNQLFQVIEQRRRELPPNSYTTTLFQGGIEKITTKIEEESKELIDAAQGAMREHITHEAADLLYHFFVLLAACDLTLNDIEQELVRRSGISGLVEKASRNKT